ncbi:sce7726 family protein [Pseudoalteromonas sp. A757]|uniref:sce7726 family protein n=1 Tax=Pseudoalteromonas sp. A757 TaxID=2250709 RepID=UPI000FFED844|nr:sce7726 family protein [Pseudoalteromonas sp. A757]RXE84303.1 hypothetical protein DRB05_20475 [Pseudoalteromonas sp. A757]
MLETYDQEIRQAFHKKKLKMQHASEDTIVVDELGIMHGAKRIDIAVVNGCIHGYEIKSSKDNLLRFSNQLTAYLKVMQKLTIILAPNHFEEVLSLVPDFVGITIAEKGTKGGIHFKCYRKAKMNPKVEPFSVAHLLWKAEVISIMEEIGITKNLVSKTRHELYSQLVEHINLYELVRNIKITFKSRANWRSELQPM